MYGASDLMKSQRQGTGIIARNAGNSHANGDRGVGNAVIALGEP
jgi:hypothetical protein